MDYPKAQKKVCQARFPMPHFGRYVVWIGIICFLFASAVFGQDKYHSFDLNRQTNKTIDAGKQKQKEISSVKVMTAQGDKQHAGTVLYVTDSLLVIWKSNEPYNPLKLNELAVSLPVNEIDTIVIEKKGHFWSGLGYGFLVGGGIGSLLGLSSGGDDGGWFDAKAMALSGGVSLGVCGASIGGLIGAIQGIDDDFIISGNAEKYNMVVPILKRNAIFPSTLPSELRAFSKQRSEELLPPVVEQSKELKKASPEPSKRRFHLSIGEVLVNTRANNDIIEAFKFSGFGGTRQNWLFGGTIDYPIDESNIFYWNVGAEYSLTGHLRLGLALRKIPKQEIHGIDEEYEYAHGTSYSLLVEYVPAPVTPLLTSRWEFALGLGAAYNFLTVDGTLSSIYGSAFVKNPVSFAIKKNKIGIHVRSSLDYYLWKSFSLQFKAERRLTPSIDVPAISHTNPNNNKVKTLRHHDVDFSSVDFSLGLRLHF